MGVDWWKNKHQPVVPILRIDMTSQQGQRLILEQGRVKVVHFAPPCGTMSRAREIPLPQWIKDKGVPEPYPLRSERHPQGLPGLEGTDLVKVQKANILAAFACDIAVWCLSHDIFFNIENPARSYLWMLPGFRKLAKKKRVVRVEFHACMHGSERDKRTALLTNMKEL